VNKDTVQVAFIRKCTSQQTLVDGLNRQVSEYATSALTMQRGICNIALDISDPVEKVVLRSST
jgi:hypothetical protein